MSGKKTTKKKDTKKGTKKKSEKKPEIKITRKVEKIEREPIRKNPFDLKTLLWVGFAIVALIVVIIAIVNFTRVEKIDSSYFHDDDEKIVLTMSREVAELDDSEWEPNITHVVYYYNGDKIINARAFYEYDNEEQAKEADAHLEIGEYAENKKLNGRFIIFDVKEAQWKNLTTEQIRKNVELLKEINALILDYDTSE